MKCYWLAILGIGVGGCMASNGLQYEAVSETNLYHIARVRKGMSEKEVLQIMHKPYKYETFQTDEDIYDVWFYVTRATGLDQTRMVSQNLTPLTFKNGILVGTGYPWYYFAMKEQADELAAKNPSPPKPKSQDLEDREFEDALKPYSEKTTPVVPEAVPSAPPPVQTSELSPNKLPQQKAQAPEIAIQEPSHPVVAQQEMPPTEMEPPTPSASVAQKRSLFIKSWSPMGAKVKPLSKIQLGMTETEVTSLLGSPSKYETFHLNDDVYDVWFYTTPLTFKNGVLVGKTTKYYKGIRDAASQSGINSYIKEGESMKEDESEQNFNYW